MLAIFASGRRGLAVTRTSAGRFFERDAHAQPHAAEGEHETGTDPFHD
jgi:hypothetical protein